MHSDEQKLMPSLKNGCPSISSPQKSHRIGILKLWLTDQPDFFHRNKYHQRRRKADKQGDHSF
jgi:hypothetical protein